MTKSNYKLVKELKSSDQDFEFYPTTNEILQDLYKNSIFWGGSHRYSCRGNKKLLDIGAGNGKIYNFLNEKGVDVDYLAIEKSKILRDELPKHTTLVGTDFLKQTLIDKEADIVFCNPPYSQFEMWSEKIINEACASFVYLVIPQRWGKSRVISDALNKRSAKSESLGTYSFIDSEDRKARATVNLVKITFDEENKNPLFSWMKEKKENGVKKESNKTFTKKSSEEQKEILNGLVKSKHFIEVLFELYTEDMRKINSVFEAISAIDDDLFIELDIKVSDMITALRNKMSHTKKVYWNKLFDFIPNIKKKLTKKNIENMVDLITKGHILDFEPNNIQDVCVRVLDDVNKYIDDQVVTLYEDLLSHCSALEYKSNKKIDSSRWKYRKMDGEDLPSCFLENRIVYNSWQFINSNFWNNKSDGYKLSDQASALFNQIMVVARNLGFSKIGEFTPVIEHFNNGYKGGEFQTSKSYEIIGEYKNKEITLLSFKGYQKGTIHLKFNQQFMKTLNIEAGRLLKWINNEEDAEIIKGVTKKDAKEMFNVNLKAKEDMYNSLQLSNCKLIGCE